MTAHLTTQELIEALDGGLLSRRQTHLEACEACREQVALLRRVTNDVAAVDLPEPSPLFWEHFSRRVHAATQVEAIPVRQPWWTGAWRPLMAVCSVVVAVILAVTVGHAPLRPVVGVPEAVDVSTIASAASGLDTTLGADDESLNFVAQVASTISDDELQQAARPTGDATDAMVEELTPGQRAELVRLLKAQIGGGE